MLPPLKEASLFRPLSDGVLELKDAMCKRRMQMRVRDLFNAERVKHLVVCRGLQALELVNCLLAVVDRDKVHEFLVLVNIHVHLLDSCRVRVDIFRDFRLRLEKALKCGLAQGHLL